MIKYEQLAVEYLEKQEKVYKRSIGPLQRFLVRNFAQQLEKTLPDDPNKGIRSKLGHIRGKIAKVAFITEDVGHLTGGRYYAWFIATALVELGFDVTVYTNKVPVFQDNFKLYQQPKIEVVVKNAKELETFDIKADIYIGSPISGDIAAARLAEKYNKPSFAIIFDPFPMMEKYIGRRTYAGWGEIVPLLKKTDINIITLCKSTSEYIYNWLNKRRDQVFEIYPCINSREKDQTEQQLQEDYVVFISRLVGHKRFPHVLEACREAGIKLKVIASIDGLKTEKMIEEAGMTEQVEFYRGISDKEKFELIAGSKAVINGAIFEGFGLWAAEGLACGVPIVCYEYPTFREIEQIAQASNMYFAEWDNPKDLTLKLKQALKENNRNNGTRAFDFEILSERVKNVFSFEPRIGIITIALNEEKFIGASLRAIIKHPNVKKVAVVEGAVNLFNHSATPQGLSLDNTAQEVLKVIEEEPNGNKIIYDRYGWATDKSELRNRALNLISKNLDYILVVDADEVWKKEDLDKLVDGMREHPEIGVLLFNHHHFWKRKDLVAIGSNWNIHLFRCFKFQDPTLHWDRHEMPVVDFQGRYINKTDGFLVLSDVYVYHYGYLKSDKEVQNKIEYYRKRDRHLQVKDTFTNWKKGDPTSTTHGGGEAIPFEGTHPSEMEGII